MRRGARSWGVGLALATPLVALTGWIVHGALRPLALVETPPTPATADDSAGLPKPDADLPRDRLEDRVDGGAEALRAAGCRRLLYWRIATPPADAEALVFHTPDGAHAVFDREAGHERTPGPGDEAQVSPQAVYFRRGQVFVRVFLDPGVAAAADLVRRAEELDHALTGASL